MRLLDLFCGAGGCSFGYARTWADVTEAIPPAYTDHIAKERAA